MYFENSAKKRILTVGLLKPKYLSGSFFLIFWLAIDSIQAQKRD
jgi:hypothetical protein